MSAACEGRKGGAEPTPGAARAQLLDTAHAIMREGDVIDISLSELAQRSGLNSALVKYYFGNKAGLLSALLDRDWQAIVTSVDALIARDDWSAEAKLRRHLSKVVDTFFDVPYLMRLTMRLIREGTPHEAQRMADTYLTPIYRAYATLIGEGVQEGVFRPVDPQLFFFSVTGAVDRFFSARLVLRHCFGEDSLTESLRDRYREHSIDLIMAGILAR